MLPTRRQFMLIFLFFLCILFLLIYHKQRNLQPNETTTDNEGKTNCSPEVRQIARKQCLKEYCNTHTYDKSLTPEDLHFLAVDDEQKFIYCVIPKVGTSTWKSVLARPRENNLRIDRWVVWKHLTNYNEEERKTRLKTYFKFMFVREPLHRMVSAYKDRLLQNLGYTEDVRKKIVKEFRPESYDPDGKNFVSFPEFIQYFSDNKTRDQHWRQYEKICHPCVIDYDFIGHYETLKQDAPLLLKMAGIKEGAKFPPIHNSTSTAQVVDYYSKVPVDVIKRIGELYRSDFKMFGYEYLGPIKQLLNEEN